MTADERFSPTVFRKLTHSYFHFTIGVVQHYVAISTTAELLLYCTVL